MASGAHLTWRDALPDGRVAVVTFDLPGKSANLLSSAVLDEIEGHLDAIDAAHVEATDVAGLIFASAKPGVFIAGADLHEFVAGLDQPKDEIIATCRRGQTLFARLASCDYPTVAAIDGVCVGGGLELALWCDRRVAVDSPKTTLALPEVKLGLMPGWGGTVRTPRLIGLGNAVEFVTGGEAVDARAALRLGLMDDVVASDALNGAIAMIEADHASEDWRRDRERRAAPVAMSDTELAFLGATANAVIQQKTKGRYPAPVAALEVLLGSAALDLDAACVSEAEAFAPLFGSPVNRALLNVFFLTDRAKKTSGVASGAAPIEASPLKTAPIETAAVVGAGIMGRGIAAANLRRGVRVLLADSDASARARGVEAIVREAAYNKRTKTTDADLAIERAAQITAVESLSQAASADVVIEAIVEDVDAKRAVFAEVEPHLADDAVLATNTSTIPVTQLAEGLARPERFCGLHFFNPVRKMPLVEVIRGKATSDETVARMTAYARALGKTPVVVRDGPGFLVNRLLLPYMNEAALLASEGVPFKEIDRAAKRFGMPMGPLELHDVVGLDTCVHAGRVMHAAMADRIVPAPILDRLVAADRLGQKNGKGFYDWLSGKPDKPPKSSPSAEAAALASSPGESSVAHAPNRGELLDRLLLPMLLEATRALEDGIVDDPRDVDLALVLGIGFPPDRGGLFFWADTLGPDEVLRRLEPLASLGKRYEPTDTLSDAAEKGKTFYA